MKRPQKYLASNLLATNLYHLASNLYQLLAFNQNLKLLVFKCYYTNTPKKLEVIKKDDSVKIQGLTFQIFNEQISIDERELDNKKTFDSIQKILFDMTKIETKGFLNHTDLKKFPVISTIIGNFTDKEKYITGNKVTESYKWLYNLIMMSLYELSIKKLNKIKDGKNTDLEADYESLSYNLFSKLDPSLRSKLQKKGISIIQNIYTGFDTEYKRVDSKFNKLISVQLAVNTKTLLKIPKYSEYELSSLHALTNESYKLNKNEKDFNFEMLENSLKKCIKEIRSIKYKNNDISINVLTEGLKRINIPYIEKDDVWIFSFPRTPIQPFIFYENGEGYSFKDLIKQSNLLGDPYLKDTYEKIIDLLKGIYKNVEGLEKRKENVDKILPHLESTTLPGNLQVKKLSRSYMSSFSVEKISVTKIRNNFLIAHLTNADLSMLKDFEDIKEELDIVNKSFITIGKPLVKENTNIIIRDTMLLSPAGNRSLDSIGSLYGQDFQKIYLEKEQKENMDVLLIKDKKLFESYALKDAIITLIHSNYMEDFNFKLKEIGVPATLSSLGAKYVKERWAQKNYKGYQISSKYLIGDSSSIQTPKGLLVSSKTGLKLSYYIANYKGGRNESFMYGVDNDTFWYDYDLTSAYTTVMAGAGNPDYAKGKILSTREIEKMSPSLLIFSYIIIKATFEFKDSVKYPSIPCYVDETTTVYPLKGECILTGAEYILAKNQGCNLNIIEIYYIPFEKIKNKDDNLTIVNHPFKSIITEIQGKRREYPKGSINNLLYKEMGNSIYGAVVRGMSDKRKFDIKTGRTIRMEAGELSNPIIASWTTGFIRSIIGECLHNISLIGGKIVSVTTDGFITDLVDLESKLNVSLTNCLLTEFQKLRKELCGDETALEVKHFGKGVISWTTRGQFSKDANIKATTGFQSRNYTADELDQLFKQILSSSEKSLEYIQSSLRSAKDIYKDGGHVTMVYKDQIFRLQFDNRRIIIVPEEFSNSVDFSKILLDSKPVPNVEYCRNLRFLGKLNKQRIYNKLSSTLTGNKYKDYSDLAIRNFIKGLLSSPQRFGLDNSLTNYSEIIVFIQGFKPKIKISKFSISRLKNRQIIFKPVPRTKETLKFVEYIKTKFKDFDENTFLQ